MTDAGLQRIVSGSAHLDDAIAARVARRTGATVIDCLGATETGTFAVREPPAVFTGLPGHRIRVADGLLRVRSPLADGEVATGDRAQPHGDGFVLTGRADGLVDASGELVSPARVEAIVSAMPGVRTCRVTVADDPLRGAVLSAHVRGTVDAERLRAALRPILGHVPRIHVVP